MAFTSVVKNCLSCYSLINTAYIAKKLCPELTLLANNFSRYSEMSKKVMDIFRRYDPNMQPAGVDEGYLKYDLRVCHNEHVLTGSERHSITNHCEEHNLSPEDCVQIMRDTVERETRLTVSAGISPNKVRTAAPIYHVTLITPHSYSRRCVRAIPLSFKWDSGERH